MAPKKKKPYTGRDNLKLDLIKGATKSGVHKDKKKEADKFRCRENDEYSGCTCYGHSHVGGCGGCYYGGTLVPACDCLWVDTDDFW